MGKKGSWFSAIKRIFGHKEKSTNVRLLENYIYDVGTVFEQLFTQVNKKSNKEKKSKGLLGHGRSKSFIPLFKGPSSIEKILGEADELHIRPPITFESPKILPPLLEKPTSPRTVSRGASSQNEASPRVSSSRSLSHDTLPEAVRPSSFSDGACSSKPASPKGKEKTEEVPSLRRAELSPRDEHSSATKIQAVYRGYLGRRSFRALKGLVRLQGVVKGQNVRRQTVNAMKQMQLFIRVQTQIQSRRIQMLENQAVQRQAYHTDKDVVSTNSKRTLNQLLSEAGHKEDWDDSVLTKDEEEARLRKKVEAVIKRERAMAYAYSHQLWKVNPKSARNSVDSLSNGNPWWWNWLDRQLPPAGVSEGQNSAKNIYLTPLKSLSESMISPQLHPKSYKHSSFTPDNQESVTPRSSKSAVPFRTKQLLTPTRTPRSNSPGITKHSRLRTSPSSSAYDATSKDDDGLMSCPPSSVPRYMAPTISAQAKVRASSNPRERFPGTPGSDSKKRFSFPLTPNNGSFKWNRGGSSNKDSASQTGVQQHESPRSIVSLNSTLSMPALLGNVRLFL